VCTELKFPAGILRCYGEKNAKPTLRSVAGKRIQYYEGVPEDSKKDGGRHVLIILDDMLTQVYSEEVCTLFTKGCHHRNISVILITQNLFHQGPYCGDISFNTKYLVLLKNTRDKQQFSHLARQVYPENSKSLYDSYLDATEKAHSYLLLDLAQYTDDRLRYRTHIFSDEHQIVFYVPPIGGRSYETIQLLHFTLLNTACPKLRKGIISNCDKRLLDDISECILNVLNGNIKLSYSTKRK
jgi:hypothetical protein